MRNVAEPVDLFATRLRVLHPPVLLQKANVVINRGVAIEHVLSIGDDEDLVLSRPAYKLRGREIGPELEKTRPQGRVANDASTYEEVAINFSDAFEACKEVLKNWPKFLSRRIA